jgi:hypothetical protein
VWTVLGALYFVWGTTYLGIAKVNETMPTLIGAAIILASVALIVSAGELGPTSEAAMAEIPAEEAS